MKKFTAKPLAAALLACALLSAVPAQAQIPVTDAVSIAQDAIEHIETLGKWMQQYQQLRQQILLYQAQFDALTGARGLGGIYNALSETGFVPDDVKQIVLVAQDAQAQLQNLDSQLRSGITHTSLRQAQLQSLLQTIDTTQDPKAIAELNARMAGEQVAVQNESNRMAALSEQMRNQERLVTTTVLAWRSNQQLMGMRWN